MMSGDGFKKGKVVSPKPKLLLPKDKIKKKLDKTQRTKLSARPKPEEIFAQSKEFFSSLNS